jgi:hypothetical protein
LTSLQQFSEIRENGGTFLTEQDASPGGWPAGPGGANGALTDWRGTLLWRCVADWDGPHVSFRKRIKK